MSTLVDEEQRVDLVTDETYRSLLARLSHQSVHKHFDAYADVGWDDPDLRIDVSDTRWELWPNDPLGATDWYRSQPPEVRARIGLYRVATAMKLGLQFENVLKRGLLEYAFRLPNGSPEFRYAYHEVAEETQHAMMFQEFVNRSGLDVKGLPWREQVGSRNVVLLGRWFPELFFLFVLGGEDPIDYVQRRALREGVAHPLLQRIMRIHVTEEARHLSFARHYLKRTVPHLGWVRRQVLAIATPLLLGQMAGEMLRPSRRMAAAAGIPHAVLREAARSDDGRQGVKDSVRKVRQLCVELGIVTRLSRRLWRRAGIWDD